MSRPELTGSASLFYNEKEARKYHTSSRMINVQREITLRAIELLRLPKNDDGTTPAYILDVGCGSGLSGEVLEQAGYFWVGCDVSRDMLLVATERIQEDLEEGNERMGGGRGGGGNQSEDEMEDDGDSDDDDSDVEPVSKNSTGDLLHHDMGTGLPFRQATFDACISISALQWLCYSNSNKQVPKRRLTRFFSSLYSVLKKNGRAVLQFYPETAEQAVLITECATSVGFSGGVVVDYPNSAKAKKHYLVLNCNRSVGGRKDLPAALLLEQQEQEHVQVGGNNNHKKGKEKPIRKKKGIKTKEWIVHKKQTQRKKGKNVRPDSKYTARRRPHKF